MEYFHALRKGNKQTMVKIISHSLSSWILYSQPWPCLSSQVSQGSCSMQLSFLSGSQKNKRVWGTIYKAYSDVGKISCAIFLLFVRVQQEWILNIIPYVLKRDFQRLLLSLIMGRSAHFYFGFGNSQFYFLIEGQKPLSMCSCGYFSEVFLMMEVKWVLLFECIVQT